MTSGRELAPGEWSVLALLADEPAHGWALAKELSPTGSVGSVWSMGRPLVYRALDLLESRGLIAPLSRERGLRGPNRAVFTATDAGRREVARWLVEPVERVREVRSLFLLKLVLLERSGFDPRPLLHAQRALATAALATLEPVFRTSVGVDHILARFRVESTRSVVSFIDGLLAPTEERLRVPQAPERGA
jgi:PadR family transcriptional regulator AphA